MGTSMIEYTYMYVGQVSRRLANDFFSNDEGFRSLRK